MLAIVYFAAFIALGLYISCLLFADQALPIRIWIGILMGTLGMIWSVVLFSFLLNFTVASHMLGLLLMAILVSCVHVCVKKRSCIKNGKLIDRQSDNNNRCSLVEGEGDLNTIMLYVGLPLFVLIAYLFGSHILAPGPNGGLFGGQSTYGDLSLHLGITTSLAEQGTFPPTYSIFPGVPLSYPFMVNLLSASLYQFGLPLRFAILIPSYVLSATLIAGFIIFAYTILRNKFATIIALLLFFLNGGFGFMYYLDGSTKDPNIFKQIFDGWYKTPTNNLDYNLRWSNVIADMIIPQRTTLLGWTFALLALWFLYKAVHTKKKTFFVCAGVVAGLMPMMHTHSLLAVGIIAFTWFVVYFFKADDKKEYFISWLICGIIAGVLALPQLFYWTFQQASEGGFLKLHFNWVNESDPWLWFWVKNVGIVFVLLIPAILSDLKKLYIYSGALVIFIIAELIIFQPNLYDNNKLFYIWYIFSVIMVAGYIWTLFEKLKGIKGRGLLLAIIVFLGRFSGILTVCREIVSGKQYLQYDSAEVEAAEFIKEQIPKDGLFLTGDQHLNPVAALAGRNIYSGTPIYLYFHGIDYSQRARAVENMYKDPLLIKDFNENSSSNSYGLGLTIDYIYISDYEMRNYNAVPSDFEQHYPLVFQEGDIYIFAVK